MRLIDEKSQSKISRDYLFNIQINKTIGLNPSFPHIVELNKELVRNLNQQRLTIIAFCSLIFLVPPSYLCLCVFCV
jgi:hypothetical protein